MKLHQLPATTTKTKPRRGRGYGSGHGGHTTGSGQKGQKTRSSIHKVFEGGQLPLTKRIPWLRGKHRFQSLANQTIAINLDQLNLLPDKSTVTKDLLVKHHWITAKEAATNPIKILGRGKLEKSLTISGLSTSAAAAKLIQKAGGSVTSLPLTDQT